MVTKFSQFIRFDVQEHTDLLFFLFYCCQGDALQLVAASLLFERGWRYHKQVSLIQQTLRSVYFP
jgi:CCR4-NOT transcriptional regulation complex NOT5 subunit